MEAFLSGADFRGARSTTSHALLADGRDPNLPPAAAVTAVVRGERT